MWSGSCQSAGTWSAWVRAVGFALLAAAAIATPRDASAQSADRLEGVIVSEIRVNGLRHVPAEVVMRHLQTQIGQPFRQATLSLDRRRLDELRLFTTVVVEPTLGQETVIVDVTLAETMRVLPTFVLKVTDENGVSAGLGMRSINLLGQGAQVGGTVRFGGETAVNVAIDLTTITPGTRGWHFGFSDSNRQNNVFDFDEHSITADLRIAQNWQRGLRTGFFGELMTIDTGASGLSLSPTGKDFNQTVGFFLTHDTLDSSTNPRAGFWAELQIDRVLGDADSWTLTLDGRTHRRLTPRQGLGLFALARLQTGEVGVDLPQYLQYALGGGNSVRGWELGSRIGRNEFIGTVEYAFIARPVSAFSVAGLNLYAGVHVAAFADLGLAWNDGSDFRPGSAIDGYGVGLRLLVPFVDVIRVDLAWGEPNGGASVYFGVALKATKQRQRVR